MSAGGNLRRVCRVCGRAASEGSFRTVCIPCAAKAKQDAAQARRAEGE